MTSINYARVFLGALAGGVVANICDFVINTFLLVEDTQRMAQRLNLDQAQLNSTATMITWTVIDFIYAFLIVWTYAAIRPRLGPGPKTAMVAALVIYAGITIVLFGFMQMGVFTPDTYMKAAALSLVTALATGLAGGALYQEQES